MLVNDFKASAARVTGSRLPLRNESKIVKAYPEVKMISVSPEGNFFVL